MRSNHVMIYHTDDSKFSLYSWLTCSSGFYFDGGTFIQLVSGEFIELSTINTGITWMARSAPVLNLPEHCTKRAVISIEESEIPHVWMLDEDFEDSQIKELVQGGWARCRLYQLELQCDVLTEESKVYIRVQIYGRFPDVIAKTIIEMWDTVVPLNGPCPVLRFQGNWNPNSLNQLKRKFSEEAQMDRKRRKREKFIRNLDC